MAFFLLQGLLLCRPVWFRPELIIGIAMPIGIGAGGLVPTTTHDHESGSLVHPVTLAERSPSRKEKLIIRLERYVQHNLEHAELLERMAVEAERWSGLETARLIRTAEENIFLQNQPLGKAALILKCDRKRKGAAKESPSIPETPPCKAPHRKCFSGKERKPC